MTTKVSVESAYCKPSLIVHAGGKNSRLGNMVAPYIELRLLAERFNRSLIYPFAEEVISRFFDIHSPANSAVDIDSCHKLYSRVLRTAEEIVEAGENTEAFRYSENRLHSIFFGDIGLKVMFGRGRLDWKQYSEDGCFDYSGPILLKDPYPMNVSELELPELLNEGKKFLSLKPDVFDKGNTLRKASTDEGALDVVFHHRQGDFARWRNGEYWFDGDLMNALIDRIQERFAQSAKKICLTIISDDALPKELCHRTDIAFQSIDLESDFARMAVADVVLSNSSTFSRLASAVGSSLLGNNSAYVNLGNKQNALKQLENSLSRYYP